MKQDAYRILDDMIEGIQIIDENFRYHYVNKTVVMHSKQKKEDLLGYKMTEVYPGIENTDLYARISGCMTDGKMQQLINEFQFPDGSTGYFELRMQRITEGVLILSYDVTEQTVAKKRIQEANEALEAQNQIINEQLTQLKLLNDTKNKFFGIVAHDLKHPLSSFKTLSSILMTKEDILSMDEVKNYIHRISDTIDTTLQMANNLIEWAKVQMKDYRSKIEDVNISKIASDVTILLQDVANNKNIEIINQIPANTWAKADKNQIEFVIRNLVNNSLKYTSEAGKITLTAVNDETTGHVLVAVIDTGSGIDDSTKQKILSGEMVNSKKGTEGEMGTGLGLMLCQEFIKMMGGKLDISSVPNEGTTISLRLMR